MLTTMDRENGLIRLAIPKNRYIEMMSLLAHLAEELVSEGNE